MTAAKVIFAAAVGWVAGGLAAAALFDWWLRRGTPPGDIAATCDQCGYWYGANELEFGVCPECAGPPVDDPEWGRLVAALLDDEDDA